VTFKKREIAAEAIADEFGGVFQLGPCASRR
jgi:hypothetical protein